MSNVVALATGKLDRDQSIVFVDEIIAQDGTAYRLSNGLAATRALSCDLRPELGDLVMCVAHQQMAYITMILHRASVGELIHDYPEGNPHWQSEDMTFAVHNKLELKAIKNIAINACAGDAEIYSRNIIHGARESLIQSAHYCVNSFGQLLTQVKGLLKMHGKQHIITAEHDVRIDGERINVG